MHSNEALVSNVVELSSKSPPDPKFSKDVQGIATVTLLHSASELKGSNWSLSNWLIQIIMNGRIWAPRAFGIHQVHNETIMVKCTITNSSSTADSNT